MEQKVVPYQLSSAYTLLLLFERFFHCFTCNSSVHLKISCASKVNRPIFKANAHKSFIMLALCSMLLASIMPKIMPAEFTKAYLQLYQFFCFYKKYTIIFPVPGYAVLSIGYTLKARWLSE